MPKNIRLLAMFLLLALHVGAQDNALSQFFANRIYLNPAFAGMDEGLQFTTTARSQWYRADGGYKFAALAVEWQEPCWQSGFGLTVQGSLEGISPLSTFGAGLTYAYIIPYETGNVHLGVQYEFNQFRLDWDRLTFSDELDPIFGSIYNTSAVPALDRVDFHDFSAGAVWRFDSKVIAGGRTIRQYRSHLGISLRHLASLFGQGPDVSFQQSNTEIPARITLHGGTIIPLTFLSGSTRKLVVSPNFRLETQGFSPVRFKESFTLFSGGTYFIFEQAILGLFYHSRAPAAGFKHTSAFTLSLGFTQNEKEEKRHAYYLGLSVDVNATGLGFRSGSVFEANFRYAIKGIRPVCEKKHKATTRKTVMKCKDFY